MDIATVLIGLVLAVVGGYIGVLVAFTTFWYALEAWAALKSVTQIGDVEDGLVKIKGTVREAETTLPAAVTENPTVLSDIVRSTKEGMVVGSWEDHQQLLRMVPFRVEDDTGSVLVSLSNDPEEEAFEDVDQTSSVEVDAGEAVPEPVASAFDAEGEMDFDHMLEEIRDDDDVDEELLEAVEELAEADEDTDLGEQMQLDRPQRFKERHLQPGDEVYVIGQASTDETGVTISDDLVFRVLTEKRDLAVFSHASVSFLFALISLVVLVFEYNVLTDVFAEFATLV